MAFNYDDTNLDDSTAAGRRNIVRFLLGDTVEATAELSDDEIAYQLTVQGDRPLDAAIAGSRVIANRYAREAVTRRVGDLQIEARERADAWAAVTRSLQAEKAARGTATVPVLTGVNRDKAPMFHLGMHDNRRGTTNAYHPSTRQDDV